MKRPVASLIRGFVGLAALPALSVFAQGMQAPNAPGSAANLCGRSIA